MESIRTIGKQFFASADITFKDGTTKQTEIYVKDPLLTTRDQVGEEILKENNDIVRITWIG